ncbi:hypothetical protein [Bordetella sp. 02P26C-1]|uniref:hypothetical protein n=1 Tax=Bordetella sp. 02P26C-1 TaxID=2683195 RepID=UPI0013528F1B|nr:hypothetical protein [Bordetella sp. 02P26C-1]MVW78081.1 hypothetical protein [Bordetella sp. 02P26C-1]
MAERNSKSIGFTERLRLNAEQGFSALFLVMGGLYMAILLLQAREILEGIFSGDMGSGKLLLMGIVIGALSWLQWRYRHVVYPMHRKLKAID